MLQTTSYNEGCDAGTPSSSHRDSHLNTHFTKDQIRGAETSSFQCRGTGLAKEHIQTPIP